MEDKIKKSIDETFEIKNAINIFINIIVYIIAMILKQQAIVATMLFLSIATTFINVILFARLRGNVDSVFFEEKLKKFNS